MTQPTALFLADILDYGVYDAQMARVMDKAAIELRRLHAQRDALLEALKTVEWHGQGSCWVVDADKIAAAIKAAEQESA